MSGIIRTKPIVTNGLIFYLDVANPKSYISGSTTTTDLIGETLGTLRNGVGYDTDNLGYLVFDGIDDDILLTPSSNFSFQWTDSWSIDAWIFPQSTTVGIKGGISKWDGIAPRGWFFIVLGYNPPNPLSGTLRFQLRQAASGYLDAYSNTGVVFDKWNHVAVTYDGSGTNAGVTFYINGVATTKPNFTSALGGGPITSGTIINSEPVTINSLPDNGNWGVDYLQSMKVYNKELSSSEVLKNYNTLKYRFI